MKISIGICVKNEENVVIQALNSIIESASVLDVKYQWSLYICLNGTTDKSETLIKIWAERNKHIDLQLIFLTKANLVESQRIIFSLAEKNGVELFSFFDADIVVEKQCLPEMIKMIEDDQSARVVYASSLPLYRDKNTILEKVLNQYDISPTIFSPRKHLHGRAFIAKTWNIPKTDPPLLIDDIYLSFYFLSKYGYRSIKRADNSVIYFRQIRTFKDFYRVFRRRQIEIEKCLNLFPEFKKLPKEQVNRQIIWSKLFRENFKRKFLWMLLIFYKKTSWLKYKLELFFNPVTRQQWEESVTSKRTRTRSILILLEGLDCSGKKTVARSMQNALHEMGKSSQVNIGPINPVWYKKLSSFVSLHSFPNFVRSLIYSMDPIISTYQSDYFFSDIVIQVSSPLRSRAYSETTHSKIREFIFIITSRKLPKYDQVWFLTAPYSVRLQRHKYQVAGGENPDKISKRFLKEEIFQEMDKKLEYLLKKYARIDGKFDTGVASTKEITNKIINHIIKQL